MSYTIYFQAYQNGQDQEVSTQQLVECFEPYVASQDEYGLRVEYDAENNSFIYLDLDKETNTAFSVDRLCAHEGLYTSIQKAMLLGNFVCLTPEGEVYALHNDVSEHLPASMQEAIRNGDLIYEVVDSISDLMRA